MRVLLGLAALVATANAQTTTVVTNGASTGAAPASIPLGVSSQSSIYLYTGSIPITSQSATTPIASNNFSPATTPFNSATKVAGGNFAVSVASTVTAVTFAFTTDQYAAQLEHRWSPNYPSTNPSYLCDACSPGCAPVPNAGAATYNCANLARTYYLQNLVVGSTNRFQVQQFDTNQNSQSYSFTVSKASPPVVGDPQIIGLQGQDFQVHGIPDEIFNLITYPNLQVNARFVYLSSGVCHDNFTACFAHPGTYIAEEGIRLGTDKIHVMSGSFKKGLSVKVNGKKINSHTKLKLGSIEMVNHRRVIVKTPIMAIAISNSDRFLNQETTLFDQKLLALGAERQQLSDGEQFHAEVPLHGLQGQTWRNVEYPSGLEYEGSISDYHVTDGNLYGTAFVFNQFKL